MPVDYGTVQFRPEDFAVADPLANAIAGAAQNFFAGREAMSKLQSEGEARARSAAERDLLAQQTRTAQSERLAKYGRSAEVPLGWDTTPQDMEQAAAALGEAGTTSGVGPQGPVMPSQHELAQLPALGAGDRARAKVSVGGTPAQMQEMLASLRGQGAGDQGLSLPPPAELAGYGGDQGLPAGEPGPQRLAQSTKQGILSNYAQDPEGTMAAWAKSGLSPADFVSALTSEDVPPEIAAKLGKLQSIGAYFGTETPEGKAAAAQAKLTIENMKQDRNDQRLAAKLRHASGITDADRAVKVLKITSDNVFRLMEATQFRNALNQRSQISDEDANKYFVNSLVPNLTGALDAIGVPYNSKAADEFLDLQLNELTKNMGTIQNADATSMQHMLIDNRQAIKRQIVAGAAKKPLTTPGGRKVERQ